MALLIGESITNARQRANMRSGGSSKTITGVCAENPIDFPIYTVSLREATGGEKPTDASAPTQILPDNKQEVSTTVNVVFYIGPDGTTDG